MNVQSNNREKTCKSLEMAAELTKRSRRRGLRVHEKGILKVTGVINIWESVETLPFRLLWSPSPLDYINRRI